MLNSLPGSGSGRRLRAFSSSAHSLQTHPVCESKCCTFITCISVYLFLFPLLFVLWHFPRVLINFNTWFNCTFDLMQKTAGRSCETSFLFFFTLCAKDASCKFIVEAQRKYFRSFMGHTGTLSTALYCCTEWQSLSSKTSWVVLMFCAL